MATLEQELLADFAEDEDLQDLENDFGGGSGEDDDMVDEEAEYRQKEKDNDSKAEADIKSAQQLKINLESVLQRIEEIKDKMDIVEGESFEDSPDYKLLTEANEYSTQIDGEIATVHKFIRDHYSAFFPHLEDLLKNPVVYARACLVIGGGPLDNIKNITPKLRGIPELDPALIMVVEIEATRVEGRLLDEAELSLISDACHLLLELNDAKKVILQFVESRTAVFAPNLTALIGSLTAAHLISYSGGITNLAKTPACNIAPLGSTKVSGATIGLSNIGLRHEGFLYHSDIVQNVRQDLRKQALRIVSGKVILAARVDAHSGSHNADIGMDLRKECEKRIDRLSEIPANQKGQRALPVPDEKPSRKRGGRRARKAKEATAMTEIRKAQNRMTFGKEEKEVGYGDSVKGMGMIGATDTGRLRAQQIDPKTRAKLSKKNPGWGGDTTLGAASSLKGFGAGGTATSLRAQGLRTGGVGLGGGAGTNSIAFTPVQGLELVDPKAREEMNRKRKADDDRWFKGGAFTQLNGSSSKVDAGGFKVPALPMKKPKTDS
ncbi:U4 U6 small nuclear ribonucleoprotein Prp31 [Pyrenophora tritici-repentis]|uniref:U4-U6 small nuclear ribonucleoprotein Prp31 n=2 Tax=Pyrenophora tritici-repentis TaxID=45151 RepID=A0A2W1GRA3_9PLEO|nr:U4/U6 small nuclear ribonucleoprotein Prp31 [Pyrenophora tritici-repentis Pt-1C-BFP]KAA8625277.1 U4/U6 small nuclear ribonucleoprotein Prp31 [Pyrenophora tritici-repentis]EDU40104.1 U4/U6 small nuclear ribonucleoprotein Prp31 [Pyrenophora tritici-repentis Pt-1C-BFP]KAF7453676.1 U4/U6 small nuclear ribonucleoprotein Prp31 [Pyrenophora tritici-repentis]KAF7576764.1 U4-U6 small nuclear ribonucleoprotein Prp31 [Pyrenophora tritici-repentis]KAG9387438.1 U4/U6 small nuclear ribonucleoprotein Prp3